MPTHLLYDLGVGPYRSGELHVLSFDGHEEMNGLYAFDVAVWGKDLDEGELEAAVLGKPAVLGMHLPHDGVRRVHGVVVAVTFDGRQEGGRHAFRLRLAPRMWLLQKRVNTRIFQDKTVREIADAVLAEHGVSRRWKVLARYPSRQYCVQYQESDYAFVTRILAEEGIFFWFDQPADDRAAEGFVIGDHAGACAPIDGDPRLVFRRQTGEAAMRAEENHVLDFRAVTRIEPTAVLLHDYDFHHPLLDLTGSAPPLPGGGAAALALDLVSSALPAAAEEAGALAMGITGDAPPLPAEGAGALADASAAAFAVAPAVADVASAVASAVAPSHRRLLEVYDHHGEYEETDALAGHAGVYLEQLRAGVREAEAKTVCRRVLPGHRFDLADHEIDKLNAGWVVARVEHRGEALELGADGAYAYENRLRCVPAEVTLRPPRPARLLRQVMESAVVVGPPGQEIFTDRYGRIKVQFHWDREGKRNEHSSCWMRVAQAWAGAGWGFQFVPRIGMEVLVSFLGGDQDRPVVVGCVANAANPVPYGLPMRMERSGIRTRTTPGGGGSNEIAFDDRAGHEQLYVHAERNLDEEVGRDRSAVIHGNRVERVDGDSRSEVRGARTEETLGDEKGKTGGSRATSVGGADTLRVASGRAVDVGGSDGLRVAANLEVSVGGGRREQIGEGDALLVAGDRSTVVRGEDARFVWGHARSVLYGGASVELKGGLTLGVGSSSEPAPASGRISGDLSLEGGGAVELAAEKAIRLRVGKTVVTIGPSEVTIQAEKITLAAKSIEGRSGDASLSMGEAVEISGKTVKLSSAGQAILELDQEAKIDGPAVKIKPGLAADAKKAKEREEQAKDLPKVKIHLFDRKGKAISGAPYEVSFFGYHDQGTSADGAVEVPAFPDVEKAHVRWGRPKAQREDPNDPQPYEFEMDVFMVVDHADEEEALRRKLHNLGHQGDHVHEAVHKLQAALGGPRTGVAADVKDEVESRHGGVSPVAIDSN